MKKDCRLRKRFGSVVTAGLVTSALLAAPVTMVVGATPAMAAEGEVPQGQPATDKLADVQYQSGPSESIKTIEGFRNLRSDQGSVTIVLDNDIRGDESIVIGFQDGSKSNDVELVLNGHSIENTFDQSTLRAHAIIASCDLTITDGSGHDTWTGDPAKVGQVYSHNGAAVAEDLDCKVTIKGGYYRTDYGMNVFSEEGHTIPIERGAISRNPTKCVVNGYKASVNTGEGSDTYWLAGSYVTDALGLDEYGMRPHQELPYDTSRNEVTIYQMKEQQFRLMGFNVNDLINKTNLKLQVGGPQTEYGGGYIPESINLGIDGRLSMVVALNDSKQTRVEIEDQTWNDGRPITPHAKVTIGNTTLSPSTDYYLDDFENNTQVGTAKVKVVGKGEYAGASLDATFNIVEPVATPEEDLKTATTNIGILLSNMDKRRYTDESVQAVQAALDEANRVLADFDAGKATTDQVQAALDDLNDAYGKLSRKAGIAMFRLYNPYSGEHLYTASAAERDNLVKRGWNYEGTGWIAPASSNTAVYRLYNPYSGDHHYTTNASERDSLVRLGWNDEGIGWFSDDARGVPLYRQFNPYARIGTHNYTTSQAENDHLASIGWRAEGIAWYGLDTTE